MVSENRKMRKSLVSSDKIKEHLNYPPSLFLGNMLLICFHIDNE